MKDYELVSFEGKETVDDVQSLIHKTIYGERLEEFLEDGECFYADYIGMDVIQGGIKKGVVKDITSLPQCDYLLITDLKGKEKMIPLLDEFIIDADIDKNTVTIVDMEGLL